ncbi:TRAP transporter small permease [Nitratireductor sp. XY-223]|uniref:TRAP transporter small permease subunit n=1 Tax=Nitratireductor sp. XY-223 TaxID=2561926 RepID=UPI0010AB46E3|nr:TRAP transporter small permease [Nitratireductor sp. XY-223]
MAGSSLVLSDGSTLSKIDRRLYRLETFMALLSGLAVFALMLLAVVSVSGRNFLNQPLPGYVDWIEQAMPLIAFLGVSFVQRDGAHIRMDIVAASLSGRTLYLVELITTFAILVLMVLMVWGSWSHFLRSFDFAAPLWSRDSSMDIALPIWPAKLLAPIAFSVLSLRLVLQIYAYGLAFWRNDERPVAVPLIADAATQAAMEAEHVSGRDD